MKQQWWLLALFISLFFTACDSEVYHADGTHFQGKDCMACHNVELKQPLSQQFAGTLFANSTGTKRCKVTPYIELYDPSGDITFSGQFQTSYSGDGNFAYFNPTNKVSGNFLVRILDKEGALLSQSTLSHNFNDTYQINSPSDTQNRFSCNACHSQNPAGGAPGVLHVNIADATTICP
jgi:hypothetical protein